MYMRKKYYALTYIYYVHICGMASMSFARDLIRCSVYKHMYALGIKKKWVIILAICTQYHYIPLLYKQKNTHQLCYIFSY